jgi:hypothetical protein
MNKKTCLLFLLLAGLGGMGCAPVQVRQPVQHIVLVWLKAGTSPEVYEQIVEGSKGLSTIGGIRDLQVGRAIPSERPIVDDSFSLGLYMRFDSVEDMNAYLTDPRHVQFVDTLVKPHLEKLVIYDF